MKNNEILIAEYQRTRDRETLRKIILANKGLVFSIAHDFQGIYKNDSCRTESIICKDDIVQYGFIGLINAIDNYQPERGTFGTFAMIAIKYHVIRELQNAGITSIRFPVYISDKIVKMEKFKVSFYAENGRFPSEPEIMQHLDIDESELQRIQRAESIKAIISLNRPTGDDESGTVADSIPCAADPIQELEESIYQEELKNILWQCVDSLETEKAEIIHRTFEENETIKQIAEKLHIPYRKALSMKDAALWELGRGKRGQILGTFTDRYDRADVIAYLGGVGRFKSKGMSATEDAAIRRLGANKDALKAIFDEV